MHLVTPARIPEIVIDGKGNGHVSCASRKGSQMQQSQILRLAAKFRCVHVQCHSIFPFADNRRAQSRGGKTLVYDTNLEFGGIPAFAEEGRHRRGQDRAYSNFGVYRDDDVSICYNCLSMLLPMIVRLTRGQSGTDKNDRQKRTLHAKSLSAMM